MLASSWFSPRHNLKLRWYGRRAEGFEHHAGGLGDAPRA
jgi:hypothetical protein